MGESKLVYRTRRPMMGRDSGWLIGSDLVAIFLALVGQIFLTKALLTEDYGIYIVALDAFATFFLIIDLGLPTLIARDGANNVNKIWPSILRVYKLQFICSIPFIILAIISTPLIVDEWRESLNLLIICSLVALVHIASYAPRSGLRAAGQAKLEAGTKVIERIVTVLGYIILYSQGSSSVSSYALVFLLGAMIGLIAALGFSYMILKPISDNNSILSDSWLNNKTLLLQALPFAITLGVLPYVIRIEKFIIAGEIGVEAAALFHVAQLAWLAGLVVPQALRAALLPVLGENRNNLVKFQRSLERSLDLCLGILPIGLFSGAIIVYFLLPMAFPEQYIDGSLGASAVDLFMILLFGWCLTLLSTPTYTALQAGRKPWNFTFLIAVVVIFATIIGYILIDWQAPKSDGSGLYAGAIASSITSGFLLFMSIHLSSNWGLIRSRKYQIISTILISAIACYGLTNNSWIAISGITLFYFIPQAIRSISPTDEILAEE